MNRRIAIIASGLAVAISLSGMAQTADKGGDPRTKTYVAACPPVIESIPRTPGPQRVMIIGAHPDDAGFTFMADKIFEEVGTYINAR